MRVHNLTDVPTTVLQNAGLVGVPIKTSGVIIQPGAYADVPRLGADAERFLKLNALFVGAEPPKSYKEAKAKLPKKEPKPERKTLSVETQVNVSDSAAAAPLPAPAEEPVRESRRERRSRE